MRRDRSDDWDEREGRGWDGRRDKRRKRRIDWEEEIRRIEKIGFFNRGEGREGRRGEEYSIRYSI